MGKQGEKWKARLPSGKTLFRAAVFLLALPFLSGCDPNFLSSLQGVWRVIPLGTNEIAYFTYSDVNGTRENDWKGTVAASLVEDDDIPYEEVTYWYTDEEGRVLSRTQTLLKNAMGNHAGYHEPMFDSPGWIDLIELRIDRGNGLENVDIYVCPDDFYILSWAFEGNSEENPLLFDPMTIHEPGWYRRNDFIKDREGYMLSFYLERYE